MEKIRHFSQLNTWKEAHKLVLMIYKATNRFPAKEQFGLTNQLQRAAVSITSNIAEGFGRNTAKDKEHFYIMAKTSLAELQSQCFIAKDLEYIDQILFNELIGQSIVVDKLISGLAKSAVGRYTS